MKRQTEAGRFTTLWIGACVAIAVAIAGATLVRTPAPAAASTPSAITIVDHALTLPQLLADESPYELIDPVGPGGISEDQAKGEVSASTMIGGVYTDGTHTFGGGY